MNTVILLLVLLCVCSGSFAGRHSWAAVLNMLAGAALVLAMLAAEVPSRWLVLTALALCAETAFAERGTR